MDPVIERIVDERNAEIADLRRKVSELSAEVGVLRSQLSCLLAERERMRVRLFEVAWEFAGSGKVK